MVYLPHGHCLNWSSALITQLVGNDVVTISIYILLAAACIYAGGLGIPKRYWHRMCQSLAGVFVFCSANYAMEIWTIWEAHYH